MIVKTKAWDAADHLTDDDAIAAYMAAAFSEKDSALIAATLGDVARASGLRRVTTQQALSSDP